MSVAKILAALVLLSLASCQPRKVETTKAEVKPFCRYGYPPIDPREVKL